jgi:hypothetical protein
MNILLITLFCLSPSQIMFVPVSPSLLLLLEFTTNERRKETASLHTALPYKASLSRVWVFVSYLSFNVSSTLLTASSERISSAASLVMPLCSRFSVCLKKNQTIQVRHSTKRSSVMIMVWWPLEAATNVFLKCAVHTRRVVFCSKAAITCLAPSFLISFSLQASHIRIIDKCTSQALLK